jgi:hypothetical protein
MNKTEKSEIQRLPEKYRPLAAWGYFWLQVLFSIPVIGFIFLIVFSFNDNNIARRSFARSFFCFLIVALIIGVIVGVAAGGTILSYLTSIRQ